LRFNNFIYRNHPFKLDSSLHHRIFERSSQPRTSQETRNADSIIDERMMSRDIIIKIPKPANETRERDPEILAYGAMLANAKINGLTI